MARRSTMPQTARPPRTIGYLRVSTIEQDLEINKTEILHHANRLELGNVEWVEEKVSGTKDWRQRKLGEVFNTLYPEGGLRPGP